MKVLSYFFYHIENRAAEPQGKKQLKQANVPSAVLISNFPEFSFGHADQQHKILSLL